METLAHLKLTPQKGFKTSANRVLTIGLKFLFTITVLGCQTESKVLAENSPSAPTRIVASSETWNVPKQIILIRHGEKIDDIDPGLSPQGCERAYQLPTFFDSRTGNVAGIFAQQPHKASSSLRPLQTIAPTASELHLKINNSFERYGIDALAREILTGENYKGNTVIISWEHSMIPALAAKLGMNLTDKLNLWRSDVFDQAWVLTYPSGEVSSATLSIVAEHVLPTDISNDQSGLDHWGDKEIHQVDETIQIPPQIAMDCQKGNQGLNDLIKLLAQKPVPGLDAH